MMRRNEAMPMEGRPNNRQRALSDYSSEMSVSLDGGDELNPAEQHTGSDKSGTNDTEATAASLDPLHSPTGSQRAWPSARRLKLKMESNETEDSDGNGNSRSSSLTAPIWARVFVFILLFSMAAMGGYAVHRFSSDQERDGYSSRFEDAAGQTLEVLRIKSTDSLEFLESWSLHMTAGVPRDEEFLPYNTIPNFEMQAQDAMEKTSTNWISLCSLVSQSQRSMWEELSEARAIQTFNQTGETISPFIFQQLDQPIYAMEPLVGDIFLPVAESAPIDSNYELINYDMLDDGHVREALKVATESKSSVLTVIEDASTSSKPRAQLTVPLLYHSSDADSSLLGLLVTSFYWEAYIAGLGPDGFPPVDLVVSSPCAESFSYQVAGPVATFLGSGDHHNAKYEELEESLELDAFKVLEGCEIRVTVYPTEQFHDTYVSNRPIIYASIALALFISTGLAFVFYDYIVKQSHKRVLVVARESTALISSLFPESVRNRMLAKNKATVDSSTLKKHSLDIPRIGKPIADLFPHATVLFADIAGFTAWSSSREPSQVFTLLESIYSSFDRIATRKKVFKVETIGDCYVAATGLPDPRADHAAVMARFAVACMQRFRLVVRDLEVTLGPDTAELAMRIGIHSGPVTAGVLRGEKSRFQLFGDTVNVASRMESTGGTNHIHLSQITADLVISECDELSVRPRERMVEVKGKGKMQTYWLIYQNDDEPASTRADHSERSMTTNSALALDSVGLSQVFNVADSSGVPAYEKHERLIDWNVDVLQGLLKKVVAMRKRDSSKSTRKIAKYKIEKEPGELVIDEVKEVIDIRSAYIDYRQDPQKIELGSVVSAQLRDFVTIIASKYRKNHFHSFEHASHVTQSVIKLLGRIVAPEAIDYNNLTYNKKENAVLHFYTYGITSDPLTQFAAAFSALIHDLDHPGVPNATLVKEEAEVAVKYKNKSVAEQNSVDLAWDLLMQDDYIDLRACIYNSKKELQRFRQLVVNTVMSTDIVDKELKALRNKRWDTAFNTASTDTSTISSSRHMTTTSSDTDRENSGKPADPLQSSAEDMNRKATIVIEHMIQASDVSHTMQHWHVYQKWNQRFFFECYQGYLDGRSDIDPTDGWYKGELGFFDFYIIPLAKKLKECGVFGVSSDEFLNYAISNRAEWEEKGEELVEQYIAAYKELIFGGFRPAGRVGGGLMSP